MVAAEIGDRFEGIERAGVHVAGLSTDDRRTVLRGQCLRQRIRTHAPLVVGLDTNDLARSDAKRAQRTDDGHVHFVADNHAQARRALQPVGLHVPSGATQYFVPRSRERGEVRHVAAGREGDADVLGQPSSSATHRPATSSATAPAGDMT
jgi:hypothetical protein